MRQGSKPWTTITIVWSIIIIQIHCTGDQSLIGACSFLFDPGFIYMIGLRMITIWRIDRQEGELEKLNLQ